MPLSDNERVRVRRKETPYQGVCESVENVKLTKNGTKLIIEVDLGHRGGPSKSGKSTRIGSTDGIVSLPDDPKVKIGLNVFT